MNNNSILQRRWRRVAARLKANRATPPRLQALVDTLADLPVTGLTHDDCLAQLPAFVLDELAGEDVAAQYPAVQTHLDRCASCGAQYALLLEGVMEAEREGRAESGTAGLDLGFLPPLSVATYVQGVAEQVWRGGFAEVTGVLETVAAAFFQRVERTPRRVLLETPATYHSPTPDLTALLTLTYLAILRLLEQGDAALWGDVPRLRTLARHIAAAEAARHGLDADNSTAFAAAFTAQVLETVGVLARVVR